MGRLRLSAVPGVRQPSGVTRIGRRTVWFGVALGFLFFPSAESSAAWTLEGALRFSDASLSGETHAATADLRALHLAEPDAEGLSVDETAVNVASWSGRASAISVNWSRRTSTGVGAAPGDPNESLTAVGPDEQASAEDTYTDGTLRIVVASREASILLLPEPGGRLSLQSGHDGELQVHAASGERWTAGRFSNQSVGTAYLTRSYATVPGQPVFGTRDPFAGSVEGDFILFVWGAEVTASDEGGTRGYRSGSWYENATGTQAGPRGAARTEHWQLLRIEANNSTVQIEHSSGLVQWTTPEASAQTTGNVTFLAATGSLQSRTHAYVADGGPLLIDGLVEQRVRSFQPSSDLWSEIEARAARFSLVPASAIPAAGPWDSSALPVGLGLVAAVAVAGVGAWVWRVRRLTGVVAWARAEQALRSGKFGRAARLSDRLIRRGPQTAKSWVIWGESHFVHDGPEAVLKPLEEAVRRLRGAAPVQFLLALAHMAVGNVAHARRWLSAAFRDPAFVDDFRRDALLQELMARLGLVPMGPADEAYA